MYQDETHVRAYQSLHATWSQTGVQKQKQIPTYGHHASVTLFGTVGAGTGKIVTSTTSSSKKEQFVAFLQLLLQEYEGKFIIIVTDNACIYRSQLVKDFLKEQGNVLMLVPILPTS